MKKLSVLFLLMLCILNVSHARVKGESKRQLALQNKELLIRKIAGNGALQPRTKNKTTTTQVAERLVAQSHYTYVSDTLGATIWGLSDSSNYIYSGERSSYFNYNYMAYYNTYEISGVQYFGFGTRIGVQDHNDRPDMLSDTSMTWQFDPITNLFGLFESRFSSYDTISNITDYSDFFTSTIFSGERYINSFLSSGDINTSLAFRENISGGWDTTEFRDFVYSSGNLVMDSTRSYVGVGSWLPEYKYLYNYDSYGNITVVKFYTYNTSTFAWELSNQYDMSYYTSNKLRTIYSYQAGISSLDLMSVDSFGWTGTQYFVTYTDSKEYTAGTLLQHTLTVKHLSATDSLPDTVYQTYFDPTTGLTDAQFRTEYSYDSYSEPILGVCYLYDNATMAYDSLMNVSHYYYETYLRHTDGIASITPQSDNGLRVYPNPANSDIYISLPELIVGSPVQIRVINLLGQAVVTEAFAWTHDKEKISLDSIPPGTYWVVVQGGNKTYRQQVVKR